MTTFLTANSTLPPYMAFPSFILDCDFSETTKLLYSKKSRKQIGTAKKNQKQITASKPEDSKTK